MSKETTIHHAWTCDWFDGEKPCGAVLAVTKNEIPYGWTSVEFGRGKHNKEYRGCVEKVFCPRHSMQGWIGTAALSSAATQAAQEKP